MTAFDNLSGLSGHTRFLSFFPREGARFLNITETFCMNQLHLYQQEYFTGTPANRGLLCEDVLNCILENLTPIESIRQSAASVLLGLSPTILAVLGSTATEIGLLSARRPLLSFFLSMGAPVLSPRRLFEVSNVAELLERRAKGLEMPKLTSRTSSVIFVTAEYVLVLASIFNVVELVYQLGAQTVSVVGRCTEGYPFLLWAFLPFALHLSCAILFALTTRIEEKDIPSSNRLAALQRWLRRESTLCVQHYRAVLRRRRETPLQQLVSVFVTLLIVSHIIYGTLFFSAAVLVFPLDGLIIVSRLIISALVCRMITTFELSGVREGLKFEEDERRAVESLLPEGQGQMKTN